MSVNARAERRPSYAAPAGLDRLWKRTLDHYPDTAARYVQLALVSVVTTVLFWQVYVVGGVSTLLFTDVSMSFGFFIAVVALLLGVAGFGAIVAGLLDRLGRANVVVSGLAATTLLTLLVIPMCTTKWSFTLALGGLLFVEGIVLVATPALVRDFSPQVGRGSAMALWSIGPACGSLLVTKVANLTLGTYDTWQSQFVIAGIASAIVLLVALPLLRELSPKLRDQLMVELEDRELVEAKAASGQVTHEEGASAYRHIVRRPRVLAIALSISIFLLLYYTWVFLLPVVFGTVFGFSPSRANGLGSWYWLACVIFLVVVGIASDRLGVRKPFMLIGAIGSAAMTVVLLDTFANPATSYGELRWIMIASAGFTAMAYVPWMASFTETVEDIHPSLVAVGLSVWGWIIRIVIMAMLLFAPSVVPSMNTLVDKGPAVQAEGAALKTQAADLKAKGEALKRQAAAGQVKGAELKAAEHKLALEGTQLKQRAAALEPQARAVQAAAADAHSQWQKWLWITVACQALFIPFIRLMRGRWTPRAARADVERHEREVERQLTHLQLEGSRA